MFFLPISAWILSYNAITCSYTGRSYSFFSIVKRTSLFPAFFNSGVMTSCSFATSTANDTSVGGTSISLKVPDMESLPPMEGSPKPICASYAPRSAAKGWLQRFGSSLILRKYSWKVNLTFLKSPPAVTMRDRDSSTAYTDPWYGLQEDKYGSKP